MSLFIVILVLSMSFCSSLTSKNIQEKPVQSSLNFLGSNLQKDSPQTLIQAPSNERILQITPQTSKPIYVISTWIKKYASRNQICHYLCQSDSFFSAFSDTACLAKYSCTSGIWQEFIFWFIMFSYTVLPLFMLVLGLWTFGCWGKYLAVMTGIACANMIYQKLSKDFEEDMETDYDISNSQIQSETKNSQPGNFD